MREVRAQLQKLGQEIKGLHFLDNESFVLDGVRVIGSTLWTHVPPPAMLAVQHCLNDYRYIFTTEKLKKGSPETDEGAPDGSHRSIQVPDTNTLFEGNVRFIRRELESAKSAGQKALVVTHHMPSFRCVHARFASDTSGVNHAFASNLDSLLESGLVHTWVFGHTHESVWGEVMCTSDDDSTTPNTVCRLACNPGGYGL
eukprot:CAMPEP_0202861564 /NCGR_PEP_ID=MMETSP1391-20130828/2923_1 /ASSEMBLY_ACC=CAM_ASM_000867 /TAXON_ID=1034604 /ORGANISM="Chlamydomonas leiostraca, Strain SAG 11-49" /LENGTH=198 /DNA_ID=CAMNT_0049540975 /DNA_START=487 /DNA_END=1079 /DNA_ORIENTATION=+